MNNDLRIVTLLLCLNFLAAPAAAKEALLQMTANPDIKQGYVDTADGQVHYWDAGQGPVLFLVHQSSSSIEEFAGMVPYLAGEYRLVAFDWPGHGNSDDPVRELGVDDFTSSGMAVLDQLGIDKFHVLGHHGGALIAMNAAWKYPDRVERIILSGTSGVKSMEEVSKFADSLKLEERHHLERDGKSIMAAWQRYLDYMPDSEPEEILIAFIRNMVARLRPFDAHYGVLRWDRRPALEAIKEREILLTQGTNDSFVSDQETLLDILPNSRRVVIENSGTFLFFERPEASAKMIADFLTSP